MALTNAERQARYRERRKAGGSRIRYRRSSDRRSRPQQWNDAVQTLLALQDQYREWRDALPESLAGSATAECSSRSAIWICRYWRLSSCPGASGVTARPPATASGWRPRRGAGRRHPEAVDACGVVLPGSDPPPGRTASLSGGRRRVAAGRPACQRAARVLRDATALRVTRHPPRGSDGTYGPCGPAWTGRPGRPRRSRDAADRRIRGWRAGPEPVAVGVTGGDGPAGLAPRGAHRVGSTTRARGPSEGDGGPPGAGGDRAARDRPTATPTLRGRSTPRAAACSGPG